MVSGFVTSPFDHSRIWSGLASEMRIAEKLLTSSIGLPCAAAAGRRDVPVQRGGTGPAGRRSPSSCGALLYLVFEPGEVDPAEVREQVARGVVLGQRDLLVVLIEDLRVEPEAPQLLDEDLEGLGDPRGLDLLALHDGLVRLDAPEDVVRFHGQQLLEDVRGSVGLERPHLHLAEPLATELRLATQRLLRDEAVRAGGPGVDLVLDEVVELEHVDLADGDRAVEQLARAAVAELDLAVLRQVRVAVPVHARLLERLADLALGRAVEDGRRGLVAHRPERPAEVRLEDLADVHAARHAERVEQDVDGGAVRQVRHVLDRQHLGDDALVAVAAGHLVADRHLALLGDRHPDQAVHARLEVVVPLAAELADLHDLAALAVGEAERGVLHLACLLAEDRAQQALLRGQLVLALVRDLADQDVAGADLGADVDDPLLVEVLEGLFADVRDVPRDLLGPELGVAGLHLVLLDVDAGEQVVAHEAVADDDRVLVVAALPAHERHEDVPAEGELSALGRAGVRDRGPVLHALADRDDRALVDARALVAADELEELVLVELAGVRVDLNPLRRDAGHDAAPPGDDDLAGVARGARLHARADDRALGLEERDRLAMHVRAHEGAVGIVMLEERDQRRRDGHDLLRADVHVVDLVRPRLGEGVAVARRHPLAGEVARLVERRVRLRDVELLLLVGREVVDVVGDDGPDREGDRLLARELLGRGLGELLTPCQDDLAVLAEEVGAGLELEELRVVVRDGPLDLAVRRLDEPVGVDPAVRGERADQADVRAFGRLDGADAAVVAVVHVADVEAGALARQAARAERRQAALGRQLGQRVRLVHELRQLRAAEELLHRRHDRADVDEGVGGRLVDLLDRHPLADHALHAQQADPERVLDQLAVGADAPIAQVVDVVLVVEAAVRLDEVADDGRDVLAGDRPALAGKLDAHPLGDAVQLLVELVAADAAEVVAPEVEEQALDQLAGIVRRGRIARAQLLVDLDERLVGRLREVLVEGVGGVRVLGVDVDGREQAGDLVVGVVPDRAKQRRGRDLALAVHLDVQLVGLRGLELQPGAAVRDHLGREEHPPRRRVLDLAVVHAGRADELAHDDALRAVDHERAHVRHPRVVAHVDALALDLAGLLDQELDVDVQRSAEGEVLGPALLLGVLRRPELVVQELELHDLAREVLDRADLVEQVPQALVDEPLEGLELELDEVRHLELVDADPVANLRDPGVREPTGGRDSKGGRLGGQHERRLLDGVRRGGDGRAHRRSRIPRSVVLSTEGATRTGGCQLATAPIGRQDSDSGGGRKSPVSV